MSLHTSLKGSGALKAKKSVWKRFERIEALKKTGKWKEGNSVYGLPKTKTTE